MSKFDENKIFFVDETRKTESNVSLFKWLSIKDGIRKEDKLSIGNQLLLILENDDTLLTEPVTEILEDRKSQYFRVIRFSTKEGIFKLLTVH